MKIRYDRGYWTAEGTAKDGSGLHAGDYSLWRVLIRYWKLSR